MGPEDQLGSLFTPAPSLECGIRGQRFSRAARIALERRVLVKKRLAAVNFICAAEPWLEAAGQGETQGERQIYASKWIWCRMFAPQVGAQRSGAREHLSFILDNKNSMETFTQIPLSYRPRSPHDPARLNYFNLFRTLLSVVSSAQLLLLLLNLFSRRADARLQLSPVEHPGKDVAQIGAQVLDATLAVAGIRLMHHAFLPKLLKNLAHLLQASVQ